MVRYFNYKINFQKRFVQLRESEGLIYLEIYIGVKKKKPKKTKRVKNNGVVKIEGHSGGDPLQNTTQAACKETQKKSLILFSSDSFTRLDLGKHRYNREEPHPHHTERI